MAALGRRIRVKSPPDAAHLILNRRNSMCEDLKEELQDGEDAARAWAEHLESMGAGKASIPIETDSGCYVIEIRKTL